MALSIKSDEADRLARELAAATGESLTAAVVGALRERLDRLRAAQGSSAVDRLRRLQVQVAALPVLDDRPADEILGYDDSGLPR
jgi:antitoxin VapB